MAQRYSCERTKIMSCTCKHAVQDELYKGKMVFNMMKDPYAVGEKESRTVLADFRCTVCGREVTGIKV